MSEEIDLKEIESKAYLSYHNDGLVDLFIGLAAVYLASVFYFLPNIYYLFMGTSIIWMLFYMGAKKALTVPRLGYVEFSSERKTKTFLIIFYILFLNIVSFVLAMYAWFDPTIFLIIEANGLFVIGVVVSSIFIVAAYGTGIKRFYIYGLVTFVAFSICQVFLLHIFLPVLCLGLVMVVAGIVLLFQFLRKYPKQSSGDELDARFASP